MAPKPTCTTCGAQSEPDARFCRSCGSPLTAEEPASSEARKVVTVVFTDLAESTALSQRLDPESLRHLMSRYFEEMQTVLVRHGGTVEKFIGDAVVAVFGIPRLHEDDGVRAVRAAVEMRETLAALNEEFERSFGTTLSTRTGVNTGEVVAGDPSFGQSFVIGDVANVAARLEQAAEPGEILIGESTYRLVREAVAVEETGPLTLKGVAAPIPAWRLLEVVPDAPGWGRRLDSTLIGRERELGLLENRFGRAAQAGTCELVTLMGTAGVGKSRLSNELLSRLGDRATVVEGRCLPYGEGITFFPVTAVLRDAAGIVDRDPPDVARQKLSSLLTSADDAALVGDRLSALLGLGPAAPGIQETFWAFRKLLEHLGKQRPLVVVFDDIHWGEPTFLDLLEYLVDWIQAPVLVVCLARPELLETRPSWTAPRSNSALITLQPLSEAEIDGLIHNLVGGAELVVEARTRIAEVAEGNPLFVEELLRILVDDGLLTRVNGGWGVSGDLSAISIPPTIHALLTARIDRLEAEERAVAERASVVGRVFWWGALWALSPPSVEPRLTSLLQTLIRKELIRPEPSELSQEDAFRFAHILIRDAAYHGIPKGLRAELHERLADWIEAAARQVAGEYEEIFGYHLEQAHRWLTELGPATGHAEELGRRAAAPLESAGRRAFARGDMPAAVNLLARASALLPKQDPERFEFLPELALALLETGDFARLEAVVEEMRDATASGDPRLQAETLVLGLWVRLFTNPDGWAEVAERESMRAIEAFETLGDEQGLAKSWSLLGLVHLTKTQFGPAEKAWLKAAAFAGRTGDLRGEMESLSWVPICIWAGPTPAEDGIRRCQEVLERARGDKKAMSSALFAQAELLAGLGRSEEARELIAQARALLQEIALTVWLGGPLAQFAGWVELWGGDPAAAERELRQGYEALSEIGEMAWLPTVTGILAEVLLSQGGDREAESLTTEVEAMAGAEDVYSQVLWRGVRAKALARRGELDEAEKLARESVELVDPTDFLHLHWLARMSLAEVLRLAGRLEEARPVAAEALRLAEEKQHLVRARRAEELLDQLGEP
jgi:class 3 adenylate cyclase/tetratricopeptide (TPR) repeat protein